MNPSEDIPLVIKTRLMTPSGIKVTCEWQHGAQGYLVIGDNLSEVIRKMCEFEDEFSSPYVGSTKTQE